jgi:hypothetical protein
LRWYITGPTVFFQHSSRFCNRKYGTAVKIYFNLLLLLLFLLFADRSGKSNKWNCDVYDWDKGVQYYWQRLFISYIKLHVLEWGTIRSAHVVSAWLWAGTC